MHSDKFFLVDGEGQVRGIYSSGDVDEMTKLNREQAMLVAALPVKDAAVSDSSGKSGITAREVAGQ